MIFKTRFRKYVKVVDRRDKLRGPNGEVTGVAGARWPDGLRIEFRGQRDGTFDTEWITDPDKRQAAETYLLNHPDLGRDYYLITDEQAAATPVLNSCIGATEGGVCGKPTEPSSDYCAECAREPVRA
jgi:hypothetical protein